MGFCRPLEEANDGLDQVTAVLQRLANLPITIHPVQADRVFGDVLAVARREQLTEYDAAYLELALRSALPLATLDQGLRRAVSHNLNCSLRGRDPPEQLQIATAR
jgi:predicted nucleic acid-binding protein